jgi:hypothetical protein
MRVHQINCPHCGSGMKSQAGIPAGQTIPCPKCKKKFAVEAADEPEVVDDIEVEDDPPPRKRRRQSDDDVTEEEEAAPGKKAKRRRDNEDDETEEQPRPKKKKKKRRVEEDGDEGLYTRLKRNILVRVITLVVLLGILGVLAYLLYQKKMAEQNAAAPRPHFAQVVGPRA